MDEDNTSRKSEKNNEKMDEIPLSDPGGGGGGGEGRNESQQPSLLPFDQRRRARREREHREQQGRGEQDQLQQQQRGEQEQPQQQQQSQTTTIPAPSGPKPHPHHRGVSWGDVNVAFTPPKDAAAAASSNMSSPSSRCAPSSMTGQEAYEAAEAALRDRNPRPDLGHQLSSKLKLDDLMQLHPMETEAETHILRALEQNEFTDFDQDIAILGNVPDEALFAPVPLPPMESDDDNNMRQQPSSFQDNTHTGGSTNRLMSNRTLGSADPGGAAPATPTYTTPVVDSVWSPAVEIPSSSSDIPNASNRALGATTTASSVTSSSFQKSNYHRRQKTTEQTLNSLTSALEDLDRQQNRARAGTLDSTSHKNNKAMAVPVTTTDPMEQDGSADTLAQNIHALFGNESTAVTSGATVQEVQPLMTAADETPASAHPSEVSSDYSNNTAVRARKNWALLKECVIQNGPAAAMADYTFGDEGASHHHPQSPQAHVMETVQEGDVEMGTGSGGNYDGAGAGSFYKPAPGKRRSWIHRLFRSIGFMRSVDEFLQPRRQSLWIFIKTVLSVILPCLGLAFLFYYVLDNPDTGRFNGGRDSRRNDSAVEEVDDDGKASLSWWILFLGVRQVVTFSVAHILGIILVDLICLEHRWSLVCFGPTLTLLIVQAKGWPCLLFVWSLLDLALLCGDFPLAQHWGHWQNWLDIFNEENPAGDFVESEDNIRLILITLGFSIVVAIKRFLIGFYQGRKLFVYYAEDLAAVMKKTLLVSQVAALAAQLEREKIQEVGDNHETPTVRASRAGIDVVVEENAGQDNEENEDDDSLAESSVPRSDTKLISEKDDDEDIKLLSRSQKRKIDRVLGNWIEPDAIPRASHGNISIRSILQFRTSMKQLGRPFPFSYAFGRASTRQECIESAQNVFLRLLAETPGETSLSFNVLALVALQSDGTLVPEKIRDLMQIFRPNHKGCLTLVDFCKSVDSIYKELRLLRASVRNSQKIDQSFERIFNVAFYTILICVCLALLGFDPLALFLSLSSFALAFSFMISRASSNYFDGLLFILCRRPYDIGDRIVVQGVESETSWNGTTDWIVKDIDLFKTTIIYAYTNEYATVSNGSLANSRILNGARSDPAFIYIILRFGIDVAYGQLELFKDALTRYVEARPRDWTKLWCLRALDVKADEGYVEYMVCVEARENWQDIFHLWHVRGVIKAFCHELAKQLEMRYVHPPMPVDIRMRGSLNDALQEDQRRLAALTSEMTADSEAIQRIIQDRNR